MHIIYEGADITDVVKTRQCVMHDVVGGRCDSLMLEFENAAGWYGWGPQEDDRIVVTHKGYDTGVMYLNTILPEDGRFRILATSLPCKARRRAYASYEGMTLEGIMRACAIEDGMDYRLCGIEQDIRIPYLQREYESSAAFLHRLLTLEGGVLKCINGRYTGIGIAYAQAQTPRQAIQLSARQRRAQYRRNGQSLYMLTVETPRARASAIDTAVPDQHTRLVVNQYPALDNTQAGRWARGLLLNANRQCERLTIETELNIGFEPMIRIDINGNTDANGQWLVEDVEHDFINHTSTTTLHRCITTIA